MERCKTCKFWTTREIYSNHNYHDVTVCDRCDIVNDPQGFNVSASAADDTSLDCWLQTGPEFGCIHHEEK